MSYFGQMVEAHKNITGIVSELNSSLTDIEGNASDIAKAISRLAGVLKIHLSNEDKYLYPSMMNSSNPELQKKAQAYQTEMGGLSNEFMNFKDNYNTATKVKQNKENAKKDISAVCKKISERIKHEDTDLYPLAKDVM